MKRWDIKFQKVIGVFCLGALMQAQPFANDITNKYNSDTNKEQKQVFGGLVKLGDILVNEVGLSNSLTKFGIRGNSATEINSYVNNSIRALYGIDGTRPSANQLKKIIKNINAKTNKDKRYKAYLLDLLSKPDNSISEADLVKAINSLIYLANRHGRNSSAVLACTACVSETLSSRGFEFTLEILSNSRSKQVLSKMLPSEPRSLTNFINVRLNKFKIGDLSRAGDLVLPEDEKALGLFLGLKEIGTSDQKDLIKSIEAVSKNKSGKVNIFNKKNPHKLWRLFSEDISDSEVVGWTKLLKEVATVSKGKVSKKETFFEILEKRAKDSPELQDRVQILKNKNCFFQ
ncbi:hypothetical protein [Halobacteriovorax sp.]|uniref:hypothetical protein n=1 Tax=Halobacteriovorax sp. TaxID=2020862 RepID=UPI0035616409